MVSVLIIIIIAVVIFQSWRKVRKGSRTKGAAGPVQTDSRAAEPGRGVSRGKTMKESSYRGKQYNNSRKSFEETVSTSYIKRDQKENILTAARENTVETALGNDMDTLASEKLMRDVYDLIVKGPGDSLPFSRDFVSEGTDMLNRYTTLPDTDLL